MPVGNKVCRYARGSGEVTGVAYALREGTCPTRHVGSRRHDPWERALLSYRCIWLHLRSWAELAIDAVIFLVVDWHVRAGC